MKKKRLDELLVERNLVENVDKAKRIIMAGLVFSNQSRMDKPGMQIDEKIPLKVKKKAIDFVSRGGLKLKKAIDYFSIHLKDRVMIDIGSSTGGFTDCALQHGAKMSYAIDVGYNQLDWKLRNDKRVVVMERTNFRYVTKDMLVQGEPNFASIDVSFISLKHIFPVLRHLLEYENDVVALIKPQFEAKKEQVGAGGIIRDKETHAEVLERVITFAEKEGFELHGLTYSPIKGGEGNIEFLAHFRYSSDEPRAHPFDLNEVVNQAHEELLQVGK